MRSSEGFRDAGLQASASTLTSLKSAVGQKQTWGLGPAMSGLRLKAEVLSAEINVR